MQDGRSSTDAPSPDRAPSRLTVPPLPVPLTPFFGREEEIARLRALLLPRDEGYTRGAGVSLIPRPCRLVTLTGLGGTGKTRLALEVARAIQETMGKVTSVGFVPLVHLTDPRLLLRTIQGALELPTTGASDPLEEIAASLRDRPFLLVLDNFEQLLGEGTEIVRDLLARVPELKCLVTSRLPLVLPAETEFPVMPLPVPGFQAFRRSGVQAFARSGVPEGSSTGAVHLNAEQLKALLECPSVRLFQSRSQMVRSEFQVTEANAGAVAQLCQALEGIPLALELAAGRAAVLTPAQMLEHLSDRFGFLAGRQRVVEERHRALRAVLEWSYQSLPENQQRLLARLSVFRGGWTLEAAAVVGGDIGVRCSVFGVGEPRSDRTPNTERQTPILDQLADLRDASLVIAAEAGEAMRFRMLETVREFVQERLTEWGEAAAARRRHRDWYLGLAEQARRELDGPDPAVWMDRLDAEHDNLRAALAWCQAEKEQAEAGLRLAGALGRFWKARGYLSEGRASLARVLDGTKDAGSLPVRANALSWAGALAAGQNDFPAASAYYEECLAVYRQLEDPDGLATVLSGLGSLADLQGNYPEARRLHEESLAIRRQLGDPMGIALALNPLGNVALEQGDLATARALYEESQSISAELGDKLGVYTARQLLGVVAEHAGDLELARTIYAECLPVWRELRLQMQVAWGLHGLGHVAYRQGDFPAARSLLTESLRMFQEMETIHGLDLTLQRLGGLAMAQGQMQRAARLLAAGGHQRTATRTVLPLATQREIEQSVAAVREVLGEEAFKEAWAAGEAMTLEEAIRCALETRAGVAAVPAAPGPAAQVPPLLATKLSLPTPAPILVPRPRLIDRLRRASTGRLALVVAPAGSGKSSLVSQWCHERSMIDGRWLMEPNKPAVVEPSTPPASRVPDHQPSTNIAWLSLDPHDNEPVRFVRYLCAALETVAPQAAEPALVRVQAAEPPPLDEVLTVLLNGLAALAEPVTFVLDDYHEIETALIHQLLAFLIDHLPPTLFLILISRRDPPLPLARRRARGELVEVRAADLRFTREEARRFLNERMQLGLAPEAVERLTERTEGWITGLQLSALSLQQHPDPEQFLASFGGTHRHLVDYLVEEVLARQAEEVRTFLRQTAILEQLCGPLCEAVTGEPGGQAMLERLEAANLFLIPLDEERRWYRYHHLFAEALRARPEPLPQEEVTALHGRAATWYEAEGMAAEALGHALAGGDFVRALRLSEVLYEAMSGYGELPSLEPWLRAVAAPLIQSRPLLSLAMGFVCVSHLRIAEVEKLLGTSSFELPLQASGPATRELQGRRLVLLGIAARLEGEAEAAEARSRQALALLTHDSPFWRGWALRTLGLACADRGDLQQATEAFAAAKSEAEKLDDPVPFLRTAYASGEVYESQGALHRAERLYQEALEFARPRRGSHHRERALDHLVAGPLFAVLGRLRYERNDLEGARAYLEQALERADSPLVRRDPGFAFVCLFEMLRIQSTLGEIAAADALFERLAATARGPAARFFEPAVAALRARRPETPAEEAGTWLEAFEARTAWGALPTRPMPDSCPLDVGSLEIGTWARLRLAQGRAEAVVARLEQFLGRMAQQGRHGSALQVRALLATLHWEARRQDRAVAVLEPALALAAREGHLRVFLEAGSALAPVLRACAAQGIAPETVAKLLAALGGRPGSVATVREDGASKRAGPLTGREMEVLRLAAAGLSNEAIAAQLFLSIGTVKRHLHNINDRLAVTSRQSAVARAQELRLL